MRISTLAVMLAGSLALGGCINTVDIDGEDGNVFLPEGEIVVGLGSSINKGPNRRDNTFSVGYSRGEGEFAQTLQADEYVDIDGGQIGGPVTLRSKADLGVGYLRFVRHRFHGEKFAWQWGAGLGFSALDFSTTDGTQTITTDHQTAGLHGLVGVTYYFHPKAGIEATLGGYVFPLDALSSLSDIRVRMVFTPAEALRLYAGYRSWSYSLDPDRGASNISFDFSGPTAGVTLRF